MKSFVSHKTRILLPDYSSKTIYELHKENYRGPVLAQDESGSVFPTSVTHTQTNDADDGWLQLKVVLHKIGKGHNLEHVYMSPSNQVWLPLRKNFSSLEEADETRSILYHRLDYALNPLEEQVLIGKNLGDGSCRFRNDLSACLEWRQVEKDYSVYALNLLRPSLRGIRASEHVSGYGSSIYRSSTTENNKIYELFKSWYVTGHKEFPVDFITRLNPVALAFWYMDDGSLNHNENQEDRALFATNSFSESSIDNLILALNRFGIQAVKYKSSGWRLRLNADEAEKFFLLVAPYIHPDKAYKLPDRYRHLVHAFSFDQADDYKPTTLVLPIDSIQPVDYPVTGGKVPAGRRNKAWGVGYQIKTEAGVLFGNNVLMKDSLLE